MIKINKIIIYFFLLNLIFIYGQTYKHSNKTITGTNRKKSHQNRSIKSNKAFKRQEKSLSSIKIVNNEEPEFDFTSTTVQNQFIHLYPEHNSYNQKSSNPIQITTIIGQNAILPCAVRNLGIYNILWLRVRDGDVLAFDNMTITQDHRFKFFKKTLNESNLMIERVKLSDSGEYACQINTQNVKSQIISLMVLSPPAFSETDLNHNDINDNHYSNLSFSNLILESDPNHNHRNYDHSFTKSVDVVEGDQLILECNAYGKPKPTINWYVRRVKSDNQAVYSLNSSKIYINNVMRNQYDYFECEAANKVPPAISRKFIINVLYRPEMSASPSKVYITSLPTQVKFNCSADAYPEANINWMFNYKNLKPPVNHLKRLRQLASKIPRSSFKKSNNKKEKKHKNNRNLDHLNQEHIVSTNSSDLNQKYVINEININQNLKQSTILISVDSETDFGTYECYSNNSAGFKSVKFYIYGDLKETTIKTTNEILTTTSTISTSTTETSTISISTIKKTTEIFFTPSVPISTTSTVERTLESIDVYTEEIIITRKDDSQNENNLSPTAENNLENNNSNMQDYNYDKKEHSEEKDLSNISSNVVEEISNGVENINKANSLLEKLFGPAKSVSLSSYRSSFTINFFILFIFIYFVLFN